MSSLSDDERTQASPAGALPTSTLLSAIALLLAAVALSLVLAEGGDPTASPADARAPSASVDNAVAPTRAALADDGLSRRVARLEAEVVMLRRALRLEAGAAVQPSTPPTRAAALTPTFEGEAAHEVIADAIETAPAVSAKIEELVDEKMQARREERWARRAERRARRDAEMIQAMREQHALDDDDANKLDELLGAERAQVSSLVREARESGGWREAREKIDAIVQETDGNVAAVLDEATFATWSTLREARASRWGRPRGGGSNGRGGDGDRR